MKICDSWHTLAGRFREEDVKEFAREMFTNDIYPIFIHSLVFLGNVPRAFPGQLREWIY